MKKGVGSGLAFCQQKTRPDPVLLLFSTGGTFATSLPYDLIGYTGEKRKSGHDLLILIMKQGFV